MITIRLARTDELNDIWDIYQKAKLSLEKEGIQQWTEHYPSIDLLKQDITNRYLFVGLSAGKIIGAVNISEEQEEEYKTVDWNIKEGKFLVVHRLVIDPDMQRQGFASQLMDYAESKGLENNYATVRLDTYSQNKFNLQFYLNRDYKLRGEVRFPKREYHFWCLEKRL